MSRNVIEINEIQWLYLIQQTIINVYYARITNNGIMKLIDLFGLHNHVFAVVFSVL